MIDRAVRFVAIPLLALAVLGAGTAQAQYRYGGYRGFEEQGVLILVEGALANVRNTDTVLATSESALQTTPLVPDWDDEQAIRFGIGYRWASGNRLLLGVWSVEADLQVAGSGPDDGSLLFAIGPPIPDGSGDYLGDRGTPGSFDVATEIEARTVDLLWAREQELSDGFDLEWSLGLRYASFEETMQGSYDEVDGFDPGSGAVLAAKQNEGEMLGVRAALRGTYRMLERLALTGSLGFSQLDGELTASSGLTPTGLVGGSPVLPHGAAIEDDGRSGSIRDFDLALVWQAPSESWKVWLGWEQSIWKDIAADLVRNFPGTAAPLRERDSVTFSGYKLGVSFAF